MYSPYWLLTYPLVWAIVLSMLKVMRRPNLRIKQYSSHTFFVLSAFIRGLEGKKKNIMKTFRFIGTNLLTIIIVMNLISCGKDTTGKTEDGAGTISSKKISLMTSSSDYGEYTYSFSYDSNGRLTEAIKTFQNECNDQRYDYSIVWGDDAIMVNCQKWDFGEMYGSYTTMYNLENGLIIAENDNECIYSYNSTNRLIKIEEESWTANALWDGDKLMSHTSGDEYYNYNYVFSYGKSCNGYAPHIALLVYDNYCLFMAHPELIGVRTKQMPTSYEFWQTDAGKSTTTFAYEFDSDGYVTKIVEQDEDDSSVTYCVTWE